MPKTYALIENVPYRHKPLVIATDLTIKQARKLQRVHSKALTSSSSTLSIISMPTLKKIQRFKFYPKKKGKAKVQFYPKKKGKAKVQFFGRIK